MNQLQNRTFIEDDNRSAGRVGKVLGVGIAPDGQDTIFYSIHNIITGQCESKKSSARVEDFNRYMQAGKLRWQ